MTNVYTVEICETADAADPDCEPICDPRMRAVVTSQCSRMAPDGALNGQSLAQKREKGSTPSLASSCLTRGMANDWAKTLPSADMPTKTGSALVTKVVLPMTCSVVSVLTEPGIGLGDSHFGKTPPPPRLPTRTFPFCSWPQTRHRISHAPTYLHLHPLGPNSHRQYSPIHTTP